jgi:hypothetical protein
VETGLLGTPHFKEPEVVVVLAVQVSQQTQALEHPVQVEPVRQAVSLVLESFTPAVVVADHAALQQELLVLVVVVPEA